MKKLLILLTMFATLSVGASEISIMGLKLNSKTAGYALPCVAAYVATSVSGVKDGMSISMAICAASVTTKYLTSKKEDNTTEKIDKFISEARRDINDNHRIMRELYSRYQYTIKLAVERVILELRDEIPLHVRDELKSEDFKRNLRASTVRVLAKRLKKNGGDIDKKIERVKEEVIEEVTRTVYNKVMNKKTSKKFKKK